MAPIFKLNMLDYSTLGFGVCLFGQSLSLQLLDPQGQLGGITINFGDIYAPFTTSFYVFWQVVVINFVATFMMLEGGVIMSREHQ